MSAVIPTLSPILRRTRPEPELAAKSKSECEPCGPGTAPLDRLATGYSRMIDSFIYEYPKLVRDERSFAKVTKEGADVKVAIIGSGFAGFTAAYELRRAGIEQIDMYEARGEAGGGARLGGRADSRTFDEDGREYVNEMGPMRVPENSKLFWHYLSVLQGPTTGDELPQFPNPGVVASEIIYQGRRSQWIGGDLPEEFVGIRDDVVSFIVNGLVYDDGEERITVADVAGWLQQEELSPSEVAKIKTYWSHFVELYENRSFIEAMLDFFDGRKVPKWGPEEVDRFSTLGVGTGGFGPLFPVCFLEIFRLFLWDYANEYTPGMSMKQVIELFNAAVKPRIHYETVAYVGVDRQDSSKVNVHAIVAGDSDAAAGGDGLQIRQYDYVVVATTLRSMQVRMNLDGPSVPAPYAAQSRPVFAGDHHAPLRQAIRVPHIMNSSKLFGYLERKPWDLLPDWPRVPCDPCGGESVPVKCVLTDSLARQIYFLDPYPCEEKAGVNVLISYNWGDDSVKIMGIEDYAPGQVITPGANSDFALKSAYQLGLESASACQHVAEALAQIGIEDQEKWLQSVIWQKEPMIFGAFKLDYPQQYHHTTQVVFQYQGTGGSGGRESDRVFLANNNCSFQGGWIEGAMQSAVNAASAVLRSMEANGEAENFRMHNLFEPNPFGEVADQLMVKYRSAVPGYRKTS